MDSETPESTAIESLGTLGLKQYEAECFAALTRLNHGTAKDLSELTDVPRTRVYDAIEVLQQQGLVDVQHSNPQQFRAVPITEATALLRQRFDEHLTTLQTTLESLESVEEESLDGSTNVWTTTGSEAITRRAIRFTDDANEEIVLIVDGKPALSDQWLDRLEAAHDRGVTIYVGMLSAQDYERVETALPEVTVFESGLEWLQPQEAGEEVGIGRLLLTDRETLMVSSVNPHDGTDETAVWGHGVNNGLLVLARRFLAAGLDGGDGLRTMDQA